MKKLVTTCAAIAMILVFAASAQAGVTWNVSAGGSIQAAINGAAGGDTIIVGAGTYAEQLVIPSGKAGLTIQGDGSYAQVAPNLGTATYATAIMVNSDNVTLRGLDISNGDGIAMSGDSVIEQHGVWDDAWTFANGANGLTVDDCKIHDIGHGVRSYGDGLVVTNSEMYHLGRSGVHASGSDGSAMSMSIQNNWFHDWSEYNKSGAAIMVKYDSRYGEVSYNYISGMRMGMAYYYGGPNDTADAAGEILFSHNTVDMDFDNGDGDLEMTMGMSFWGTGENVDGTVVRDNIFANARWYALYQEGATIDGAIEVDNNLFYNNYHDYWPDYQYPFQWFGDDALAQAGWWDGPADGFTFTDNITALDPMFSMSGMTAEEFWALMVGSPALLTASDGTNIGAYQGAGVPEPATMSLLAMGALAMIRKRNRK